MNPPTAWIDVVRSLAAQESAAGALATIVDQGILGALLVVALVVIAYLYREKKAADERIFDMAIKTTDVLAKASASMDRSNAFHRALLARVKGES